MTNSQVLLAGVETALQQLGAAIDSATATMDSALAAANADRDALIAKVSSQTATIADLQAQIAALKPKPVDPWDAVDKTATKDVTAALQKNIDAGLTVPAGRYLIDPLVSIKPKAGANVVMEPGAVLVLKTNGADRYYGILIAQPNVTVQSVQIVGDRDTHDLSAGGMNEHGMGIGIVKGGDGAQIIGAKISKCSGDGICIGGGVTGIKLSRVISTGNRRQGMSITNASNVLADDCEFTDTQGTSPECGVDVEPDSPNSASNVILRRCRLARNNKYGVNIFARVSNVTLEDCTIEDNASCGVVTAGGNTNTVIKGGTIQRNGATGIKAQAGTNGLTVDDVTFFNNYHTINDKDRVDFDAAGTSTANYRGRDILIDPTATNVRIGLTVKNHYK